MRFIPVDRVRAVLKMAQQPISLQSPVGDTDTPLRRFIEDRPPTIPRHHQFQLLKDKLGDVLCSLTERNERC